MEFRKEIRNGIEIRFDPLLGWQTRINPERARRPKQRGQAGAGQFARGPVKECPFCPENILEKTPTFPADIADGGRIAKGETCIFPNLNPFGENHAVGVMTERHFVPPDGFSPAVVLDCLAASQEFFLRSHEANRATRYPVFLWNYMPPSAGSIVHPHVQLLLETEPLPVLEMEMRAAREYDAKSGRDFWRDLVEEERNRGERFIGSVGAASVLASFAPRGFNEVQIVLPGAQCFAELSHGETEALARCICNVLSGYAEKGVGSFNIVALSGALGAGSSHFSFHTTIISRPYPHAVYTNDTGPFERLCDVWVIDTLPESLAAELKEFF